MTVSVNASQLLGEYPLEPAVSQTLIPINERGLTKGKSIIEVN